MSFNKLLFLGYTPPSSPCRFYQALSQNKASNAQELWKISFARSESEIYYRPMGTIPINPWEQPLPWSVDQAEEALQ